MGRQEVLSRGRYLLAWLLLAPSAWAQEEVDDGLHLPQQVTVGVADEFLAQLAPDGKRLYFVSNRNTTNEIYWQNAGDGHAGLLFDEGADVTWPRPSPDGRQLLYVSFRDHANGQLCVRDLPGGEARRCLEGEASALQAEWRNARQIIVVSRTSIQGDLQIAQVTVGRTLVSEPLFERNLTSPAVSPDGRWLVYAPIERYANNVGPAFAARAEPRLEAMRLDREGPPVRLPLDLPGLLAQPTFGRDGHLYFASFYSDSNHDGVIDASDHGVLFRVPFPSSRDDAPAVAAAAVPEQLTDASYNCQYPAPGLHTLVATCSSDHSLDIYELPLSGEIPSQWDDARMGVELELSTKRSEQLLLDRAHLAHQTQVSDRRLAMMDIMWLHLGVDEFRAAEFYVQHLHALKDPATHGLAHSLFLLIEHREAARERERGRLAVDFMETSRLRMSKLVPRPGDSEAALVFAHVVRSEIADSLGDKALAREELENARLTDATPSSVVEAYYERADALYRELDDPTALAAVSHRLAQGTVLDPASRLRYARAWVRTLVRGQAFDAAVARLEQERGHEEPASEAAFALELGQAVLGIRDANPSHAVRDTLMALYRRQERGDRRRAVMLESFARAWQLGADKIMEGLADAYLASAPRGHPERRRAEQLYRRLIMGRAYRRLAEGHLPGAEADFAAVARNTGSFESAVALMNLRLSNGETVNALLAEALNDSAQAPTPLARFMRSYLLARALPSLAGNAHARGVEAAMTPMRPAWSTLREKKTAQALFGAILVEDYLRSGELATAERANVHLLVALDLSQDDVRYRAMLLEQLGLLQLKVKNWRVALGFLKDREKLPAGNGAVNVSARLATARALLHAGQEGDAATVADGVVATVDASAELHHFEVLVLDRAALDNLAASRFARSVELYDREMSLLESGGSPRNVLLARIGRAAALVGANQPARALVDLGLAEKALAEPTMMAGLRWAHARDEDVHRSYALLLSGLRAHAERESGAVEAELRSLETRRSLLMAAVESTDNDGDVRGLMEVETRLAAGSARRHAAAPAAAWIARAVQHADVWIDRTHEAFHSDQLDVLRLAAELAVLGRTPVSFYLHKRLTETHELLLERRETARREDLRWLEVFLAFPSP